MMGLGRYGSYILGALIFINSKFVIIIIPIVLFCIESIGYIQGIL